MNPVHHLLAEHRDIMAQIADLRTVVHDLELRGDAALPEVLPTLRRISHLMETQVARHARKEDEVLFPAVERMLGPDGGPTAVMRLEHDDVHANSQRLRALLANNGRATDIAETAEAILALLDSHFEKEEQMLFPMIEAMLDDATLAQVARQMEALIE